VDEKYIETWGNEEFETRMKPLPENIDIDDLPFKTYFTEDEMCFLELLTRKSPLTIDDILIMKDDVQICKDCDSMNKIITTGDILERKWLVKKSMLDGKVVYSKSRSVWV